MSSAVCSLLILAAAFGLFLWNRVPLPVVAMLAAACMGLFGCSDLDNVFSALSSQAVLLLIGMMVLGEAMTEVGIVERVVHLLERFLHCSERKVLALFCVVVALVAALSNALVVVAAILPVVDRLCDESQGHISRRRLYLPICVASYYGCTLTAIGASSMLNVSAQLEASSAGRGLSLFEPATAGLPALIVMVVYALTFGYRISERAFNFKELAPLWEREPRDVKGWRLEGKAWFVLAVFVATIALMLFTSIPYGTLAMVSAFVLILSGCVGMSVFRKLSWSTIFTIVGSIGMGLGFSQGGAGELTATFLLDAAGSLADSPFAMCCVMLLVTTLISNVMSNNAAVSIMCPIAFGLATSFGCDPTPFAVACGVGALLSCCTPLCNANIAVAQRVGYPFADYAKWGVPLNLAACAASCAGLYFAYFL